jgi:hypothetical protein
MRTSRTSTPLLWQHPESTNSFAEPMHDFLLLS